MRVDTPERRVRRAAVALVLAALVVRAWVAWSGYFYWDDLILVGRGASFPLLSGDLLLYDHDGHVMPGAFVVAGVVTRLAPMVWALPVLTLVVMQALASLAVLRLLHAVLGWRIPLLVPLAVYLFSALTLPSFAWWSAALNALPLQAALAWVAGEAILLARDGRRRRAVSGSVVLALGLAFFEKSVVVPFVAFAAVALLAHVERVPRPLAYAFRRAGALWIGALVVLGAWVAFYTVVADGHPAPARGSGGSAPLVWAGAVQGFLPALGGGPLRWQTIPDPGPFLVMPFADPPPWWVGLTLVAAITVVVGTVLTRERVAAVWAAVAAYLLLDLGVMVVARAGPGDGGTGLALTLRYVADGSVLVALAVALVLRARRRTHTARPVAWLRGPAVRTAVLATTAALVVLSLVSTAAFARAWSDGLTRPYLDEAVSSLAGADRATPLLDQAIPARVLFGLAYPNNQAAQVFAGLRDRPPFGATTPSLQVIDDRGAVVPTTLQVLRRVVRPPTAACRYQVSGGVPTEVVLDGPLLDVAWTTRLAYRATRDGMMTLQVGSGASVPVPVTAGEGQVFVRFGGGGSTISLRSAAPGLSVCITAGEVGLVEGAPTGGF